MEEEVLLLVGKNVFINVNFKGSKHHTRKNVTASNAIADVVNKVKLIVL